MRLKYLLIAFAAMSLIPATHAAEVVRHANQSSTLPIATAVEVDDLLFHSGVIPSPANAEAERGTSEYWGDTEAQTRSVLGKIQSSLEAKGYDMGDIVKLTVFLVAPDGEEGMDFQGLMRAYTEFFGEASGGRLPARSVVEVAGLVAPGMLVEIEAIAAKSN